MPISILWQISRNTGILNKIKLFLPSRILKTIYSSLILCQLNYVILVWGLHYKRIFKLQKQVMRIIICSKVNAHSEPLFKELKLLKLEDIRKLQELKSIYIIQSLHAGTISLTPPRACHRTLRKFLWRKLVTFMSACSCRNYDFRCKISFFGTFLHESARTAAKWRTNLPFRGGGGVRVSQIQKSWEAVKRLDRLAPN